jgi:arylsulfatase A-like enzyme
MNGNYMKYLHLLLVFWLSSLVAWSAPSRPNIVLIMVDDMGFGDIRMSGNPLIHTPNLDRLAAGSVNFSNFYVSPVCAPTRASLLTGRYHQRTGVRSVTNGYETMNPEEITLAEVLAEAGYQTGLFGKWHLGEHYPSVPHAQGFQKYIGFRTGHFDNYFDPTLEHNGQPYPTRGYISDVLADEAIRFMKSSGEKPFFCYVPFNAPHTPLDVPEAYLKKYQNKGLNDRVTRIYAMMENLDDNIGRILNHLKASKLDQNTIVVFMSDNGPLDVRSDPSTWRYNVGLRDQKFSVYEGGIRSRFFVRWPARFSEQRVVSTPAAHIDVLPTLLDLCGLSLPAVDLDGKSLVPLMEGKSAPELTQRNLFLNYSLATLKKPEPYPGGILISGGYKMVDGKELYNLTKDPGEKVNLAREQPQLLARLDSTYRQWWHSHVPAGGFQIRPVPVGYTEEPATYLPPHLGRKQGGLEFRGYRGLHHDAQKVGVHPSGVDGDWVANWKTPEDRVVWQINVVEAGRYDLGLTLKTEAAATLAITVDRHTLTQTTPAALADWQLVPWGNLWLDRGEHTVVLRADKLSKDDALDVKNLLINKNSTNR